MALNLGNKHIINRIRTVLADKNDEKLSFEDKVMIANSAIMEYSSNVFNYKQINIVQNEDFSYTLPNDLESIVWIKWKGTQTRLEEGSDYYISEGKIILNSSIVYGTIINSGSGDITMYYDGTLAELVQEEIGEYAIGSDTIIDVIDGTKYNIGEYILIKTDTLEQVAIIKDIIDNTITVDLMISTAGNGFITGNCKIDERFWGMIDSYAKYKNYDINTSEGITSKSWTQGARSQTINYSAGKSSETILESFYTQLKANPNYRFKKLTGLGTTNLNKV